MTPIRAQRLLALAILALVSLSVACAYSNVRRDNDTHPVVNTGAGASVMYPNQTGPTSPTAPPPGWGQEGNRGSQAWPPRQGQHPAPWGRTQGGPWGVPSQQQGPWGQPQAAPGQGGAQPWGQRVAVPGGPPSAASRAPSGGMTYIGGSEQDEDTTLVIKQEPVWLKYLAAPFAVVALPFKKVAEAVRGDNGEPPPQVRNAAEKARERREQQAAYDDSELEALERELGQRSGAAPAPGAATPGAAPSPRPQNVGRPLSIAEELAALRRGSAPAPLAATAPPAPIQAARAPAGASRPAPAVEGVADQVEDRDRDGRPDRWIFRSAGKVVREVYDENGDGVVDRTLRFDPSSGQQVSLEEDTDLDGQPDSWVEYARGEVVRRRSDGDGNGFVDTWTFYRDGQIFREERDLDGDGFRDRIGFYRDGRLHREEEDADGDGRPNKVMRYDAAEKLAQMDEDRDGDGAVDVRSYYEGGRLARREMLEESLAEEIEQRPQLSATWDESPSEGDAEADGR